MALTVKCYATLAGYAPPGGEVPHVAGRTAADLIAELHIAADEVKVIFVNGLHASLDKPLMDGDRVGIFPAVGGG